MRVIICDDSILARKQLIDSIKQADESVEIVEAKNGQECVDLYDSGNHDLVFIDIVMPVLDGVSAVKAIMEKDPGAKVIIVSSVGTQKELREAITAGARDFIQKPFSKEQIKEVIKFYLKG